MCVGRIELFGPLPGEMDVLERASWSASALARLLDALLEGRLSISIFPSIQGVRLFEFGAVNNQQSVNRSGKQRLSVEGIRGADSRIFARIKPRKNKRRKTRRIVFAI